MQWEQGVHFSEDGDINRLGKNTWVYAVRVREIC